MAGLGENHRRRILATFQHADELLRQSLNAIATAQPNLQSPFIQDLSPSEVQRVESDLDLIRNRLSNFLKRLQIASPERSTRSSWILKTNLMSLDIALEELYPLKMKGYGEMDPATAHELTQALQEIRKLVNQLIKSLE